MENRTSGLPIEKIRGMMFAPEAELSEADHFDLINSTVNGNTPPAQIEYALEYVKEHITDPKFATELHFRFATAAINSVRESDKLLKERERRSYSGSTTASDGSRQEALGWFRLADELATGLVSQNLTIEDIYRGFNLVTTVQHTADNHCFVLTGSRYSRTKEDAELNDERRVLVTEQFIDRMSEFLDANPVREDLPLDHMWLAQRYFDQAIKHGFSQEVQDRLYSKTLDQLARMTTPDLDMVLNVYDRVGNNTIGTRALGMLKEILDASDQQPNTSTRTTGRFIKRHVTVEGPSEYDINLRKLEDYFADKSRAFDSLVNNADMIWFLSSHDKDEQSLTLYWGKIADSIRKQLFIYDSASPKYKVDSLDRVNQALDILDSVHPTLAATVREEIRQTMKTAKAQT